ncbi:hypothetical protein ACIQVE_27750 [Pseudomonas sp. NPDC098747]|uniref:hypothetical protein n=1 Tax=Pseudomonas sp. NPDC098747 TaxID=3364487 RepID=UPI00383BE519
MKKLLIGAAFALGVMLYGGYYLALEDGDIETILFIKKHPTLQMRFYNIHANDGEVRQVERLTDEERKMIIDYCRYRLGLDTVLRTQDDVERCRLNSAVR